MRDRRDMLRALGGFVGATIVALAVAAPASAATRDYQGGIGQSGAISFSVKGKGDRTKVIDLEWYRLPVDCGKKDDTSTGTLTYAVSIDRKGKFATDAISPPGAKHPKAEAIITGKVNGSRAHGTITVRGSKLPVNDAGSGDCDSGKQPWNAAG